MAYVNTQFFAPRRAPDNWDRVTLFVVFVRKRVSRVWLGVYAAALFRPEPESTAESARNAIKESIRFLGMGLAPDNEIVPTISTLLLWAQIEISHGFARASIPKSKAIRAIGEINEILKTHTRSPSQSSKLSGRLGFAPSHLFGRFGRAMLKPLAERQYSVIRRCAPLHNGLRIALVRLVSALMNPKPRRVPLRPIRPCFVYTDACGEGNLCAVLRYPVEVTTHGHAPMWMHKDTNVGIYEWGSSCSIARIVARRRIYQKNAGYTIHS